jgi:hypothetical protein
MSEENQQQIKNQIENNSIDLGSVSPYMSFSERSPIRRMAPKVGRNQICEKTSKKFKHCCGKDGLKHCREEYKDFLEAMQNHLKEKQNKINSQENNA